MMLLISSGSPAAGATEAIDFAVGHLWLLTAMRPCDP